jgi:ribosomal protein S11
MLSACSLAGPNPHTFTPKVEAKQAKPEPTALEQASQACKDQTRERGIKSVLAIVTRMRPGAVDADYIDCMKRKGYAVER